ncbi:hypothetical protein GX48_01320 [Paracoccidioides brasiliensis]|nr:hypothetical protein GX48_01320 [Paracoccidioides brasiliensis]
MRGHPLLSLSTVLAHATLSLCGRKPFNVYEDVLAFPQFEVVFPYEYILSSEAQERLAPQQSSKFNTATSSISASSPADSSIVSDRSRHQVPLRDGTKEDQHAPPPVLDEKVESYEEMVLDGMRYVCTVPKVVTINETKEAGTSPAEQEKELARAADRGLELLSEMKGSCMYYVAGWWSYSFCYMDQVRQFHALPPGNGVPVYPPAEDPTTNSYVLGRFRSEKGGNSDRDAKGSQSSSGDKKPTTEVAELQTKGDSRYLVQHLEDGTVCDLTGRDRKIEIQFHCHPQSTDHIGWIKEVSTCTYLMIIYTPRLCNDVAFQPPREHDPNPIVCKEIIESDGVDDFEETKAFQESEEYLIEVQKRLGDKLQVVGDIQVGAMKLVGREGKRIEKGKVASAGEERVEIVAKREAGEIHRLSKEELKKFNLDVDKIETLKKQLEELAEGKNWKLEVIEANGRSMLRGVIETGSDENEEAAEKKGAGKEMKSKDDAEKRNQGNEEEGSDETYKDEL